MTRRRWRSELTPVLPPDGVLPWLRMSPVQVQIQIACLGETKGPSLEPTCPRQRAARRSCPGWDQATTVLLNATVRQCGVSFRRLTRQQGVLRR